MPLTGLIREAVLAAAERAGGKGGMIAYLEKQAHEHPAAFLGLLGKILPTQIVDAKDEPLVVEIRKFYEPYEAASLKLVNGPMKLVGNQYE